MSRKNFKVATTEDGKTTMTKIDKTPTGKVKIKKAAEERRKAREESYKAFRINALTRRCKRMKISEEDTKKYVEKLIAQLEAPHMYAIHVLFKTGQKEKKQLSSLAREAILNSKIEYKILTKDWAYIIGDSTVLAKLREILPTLATIHPYVMKAEPILPVTQPSEKKKSNNSKDKAAEAKAARKMKKVSYNTNRARRSKTLSIGAKRKRLAELKKSRKATISHAVHKKPSVSLKKASKDNIKQAA